MEKSYFDQNVTKKFCNNHDFLNQFFKIFKSPPTLIITPRSLIELSGSNIIDCLKENTQYNIDFSDSLPNQVGKAYEYYENSIRGDIITFLKKALKTQKQCAKTEPGRYIFTEYEQYLNSVKGMGDICQSIVLDRISALPLEEFKGNQVYWEIYKLAFNLLVETNNLHIPYMRLFIKSVKKLPSSSNYKVENRRKYLKQMVESSDVHEEGDLVDIEMTQLAIMGYNNHPLHFYTGDNAEKIKKRLFLFYSYIEYLRSYINGCLEQPNQNSLSIKKHQLEGVKRVASLDFRFGTFSIIDDFGCIQEDIDVESLLTNSSNNLNDLNKEQPMIHP